MNSKVKNNSNPIISYVLVTYNSAIHFPDVVENIRLNSPAHEIIVVDNASSSTTYLRGDKIIKNTTNLMFTPAANQGIDAANKNSEFIVLVNPDIRLSRNAIETMIGEAERVNAGIAAPVLVYPDLVVQHGGGEPLSELSNEALLARDVNRHLDYGSALMDVIGNYPRECRWVTGALFMITRHALNVLGKLDERYTHYGSDLEYCLRAGDAGIKVICSSAICLHFHKKSSAKGLALLSNIRKFRFRSNERRFHKCLGRLLNHK